MHEKATKVAVIGFGAIGSKIAGQLLEGRIRGCELVAVLVRSTRRVDPEQFAVTGLEELEARSPDVVVEAASHEAVRSYGEPVLQSGRDLVCVSVGALADDGLRGRLTTSGRGGREPTDRPERCGRRARPPPGRGSGRP